ncbi:MULTISPECIES: pirin family protein [Deefgea]|uniref:Quercetin 2,3-dioxygenase n=1 Tax=Deefgea chitinilytica TaxID=570276 RepID=A0ABS2CA80_9NEIS|nr:MULTISPECIES: pirin family protein [Deefgea]MBM5571050.1 quercetin 2,3-dioxygenase [Deefgea chitinilytica]MBM9888280.1 pirin family protein [Deefgea sp. CFH1-16]
MITIRKSNERGHANHGWLDSNFSFSFAEYYDPAHMHFGALRVINDDRIAAGMGFGMHPHQDMEIITYVLAGAIEHKDSMGNGSVIRPGNVQRMSAGTGVRHSEFNPSSTEQTHLLQIWILPARKGDAPSYEEKEFSDAEKRGQLRLVASPDGAQASVTINQDVKLYAGLFDGAESAVMPIQTGRKLYVHLARGEAEINGLALQAGDAVMLTHESQLTIQHGKQAEVLVFDLF